MSELANLYQELILDHNARPRNFGELPDATHRAEGSNPLCGDQITVALRLDDAARIVDLRFVGKGCAICKASASLMTAHLKGKTVAEAQEVFENFHTLVSGAGEHKAADLGKLLAFAGVRAFPMRVKCATLAWHTLRAAFDQRAEAVTTEST